MASVRLLRPDLSLLSDPAGTQVVLPHLYALKPSRRYAGTLVTFAGDTAPTAFRGTSRLRTWALGLRYAHNEQAQLAALLALLERAADAADGRLLLRTHHGQVPGIDDVSAVVVLAVETTPQAGLVTEVSLTAEAVAWTAEV